MYESVAILAQGNRDSHLEPSRSFVFRVCKDLPTGRLLFCARDHAGLNAIPCECCVCPSVACGPLVTNIA